MSFKDATFSARWLTMGDPAENAYRRYNPKAIRTGLDRAATTRGLSAFQRYEPDFRAGPTAPDFLHRIECMGIGRDQLLKLKTEKLFALIQWDVVDERVDLYVWDSSKKRQCVGPIDQWFDVLFREGVYAEFPDNDKPYVELHSDHFPYEWTDGVEEEDEAPTAEAGGAGG